MAKNKLFIVPVMGMALDLTTPTKVFYVHEVAKGGLLLQKHGLDLNGSPFPSKEAAKRWVDTTIIKGLHIFKG